MEQSRNSGDDSNIQAASRWGRTYAAAMIYVSAVQMCLNVILIYSTEMLKCQKYKIANCMFLDGRNEILKNTWNRILWWISVCEQTIITCSDM